MDRMVLLLKPDYEQQKALDELLKAQHDRESPYFHRWLTPESFGQSFGISPGDLAQVTSWLQSHGFHLEEILPNRQAVIFSGNAIQVESAFHTSIRQYKVAGELHHANSGDPEIPQSLAEVVGGVLSLHDFRSQAMHSAVATINPQSTLGSAHYLAPADFSIIYDLDPLYDKGISGSGQTVAIIGRSNINLADVRLFVAGAPSSVLTKNGSVAVRLTTNALAGFNSPIALSISGVPAGVTASLTPTTLPAPGSGVSTLTFTRNSAGTRGSARFLSQPKAQA
jgi:hypothetical protein